MNNWWCKVAICSGPVYVTATSVPVLHKLLSIICNIKNVPVSAYCSLSYTHPFNGFLSRTTQVSRYQKRKTNLDFTGARDSEWHWNQLDHMQVCTLLQTDNHASTHHSVFYRPDALPAAQPTVSMHWRLITDYNMHLCIIRTPTLGPNLKGKLKFTCIVRTHTSTVQWSKRATTS